MERRHDTRRGATWARGGPRATALALLLGLGCAPGTAAELASDERGTTDVPIEHLVHDGGVSVAVVGDQDVSIDSESELSELAATIGWREVRSPRGDEIVPTRSLTLFLETNVGEALEAQLVLTVRADGEEIEVPLDALRAVPGRPAERVVSLDLQGVDFAALEHPAQLIVEATLRDTAGATRGSAHTPDLYVRLSSTGELVAATPEAVRTRFAGGATSDQRQRGVASDVASFGRGRMARPEDLHGDPDDARRARATSITSEGGV